MKTDVYKYRIGDGVRLFAALAALADLEEKVLHNKAKRATASLGAVDPESIVKKISALRTQFKNQSLQVKYESQQKLASLLREIAHVLTDEIHAMSVCGDNTDAMKKLQAQIFKVTDSLSFVGDDDSDRNGIRDDASEEDLELGAGKSTKHSSHDAFLNAVKSLRTDKSDDTADKADDTADDADSGKGDEAEDNDEDENKSEDASKADKGNDNESKKKLDKKKKKKSKILKDSGNSDESEDEDSEEASKDTKGGGFVDGLLSESSTSTAATVDSFIVTAGLRFVYLGVKKVRKDKKVFDVIAAAFGVHGKPQMKVYFYKPTDKFFKGDVTKVDTAFKKLLSTPGGYSLVSTELNARVKSGHLEIIFNEEKPAKDVLGEAPSWSFRGIGDHPVKEGRKALFFEIGNKLFAAVPSKNFEDGDIDEAANYIRLKIVGSKKDGAPGLSYNDGLAKLQKLAETKKLKIIFQSNI